MSRLRVMQATASKSFIEVLEQEIRADLRKEIEAELAARYGTTPFASHASPLERAPSAAVHAAGRLETWLASHVGPITFKTGKGYGPAKAHPAHSVATPHRSMAPNATKTFTATTPSELFALEILNRQSPTALGAIFTEDELKAVWRKAALKTHPDRFASSDQITQVRMTALFRELAESYEILLALTNAAQNKAA